MVRSRTIFLAGAAVAFAVLIAVVWLLIAPGSAAPHTLTAAPQSTPKASFAPAPTPHISPAATKPATAPGGSAGGSSGSCTNSVLVCVNQARAARGIAPLSSNGTLNAASQSCAERMAASGQMTHSSGPPAGYSTWGENIARGYPSASSVFEAWMGSDGHRANILNPSYTQMGLGYVASGNWWCQQFGA
jgi:uncharacterized protein YkwD